MRPKKPTTLVDERTDVDRDFEAATSSGKGKIVRLGSFGLGWLEQSALSLQSLASYYSHCVMVQSILEKKHKNWLRFRTSFDFAILVFGIVSSLSGFATFINYLSAAGIWTVASALVAALTVLRPYLNFDSRIERYLLGSSSYLRAAQEIDALVERTGGYSEPTMNLFKEQALMLTQRVRELDSQFVDFLVGHKFEERT